jgi:hypothetical protein
MHSQRAFDPVGFGWLDAFFSCLKQSGLEVGFG